MSSSCHWCSMTRYEHHWFQNCGMKTRKRLIDIRKVAATVGIDVCRALDVKLSALLQAKGKQRP